MLGSGFRSLRRRLGWRSRLEREMAEELEFHLAARADDLVTQQGLSRPEALRRARIEFGSVEKYKEEGRRAMGCGWIDDLRADLKHAVRQLRAAPVFVLTASVILGLGIGGSTTIFALVDAVLLQPLPYPQPERLVRLALSDPGDPEAAWRLVGGAVELQEAVRDLVTTARYIQEGERRVITGGDRSELVQAATVTPDFFAVLGVQPMHGPGFAQEEVSGASSQVMLGEDLWRRLFNADPEVVGLEVRIEGSPLWVVAGVMPRSVTFPEGVDLWLVRPVRSYGNVIGRLNAGVTPDSVRLRLEHTFEPPVEDPDAALAESRFRVEGLHTSLVRDYRAVLLLVLAAVTLVLVVACANVANLVLARDAARGPELALRSALGASRPRMVRFLLSQSLVLGVAGGFFGLMLASMLVPLLAASRLSGLTPRLDGLRLDFMTLGWCALLSLATAFAVGLLPALKTSRIDLLSSIQSGGSHPGWRRSRLQLWLVGAQTAVSVLLVIGALLVSRSLIQLSRTELGFNPEQLIAIEARIPLSRGGLGEGWYQIANQSEELKSRLAAIPGVESAATTSNVPLASIPYTTEVTIYDGSGAASPPPGEPPTALYLQVTTRFFETMGIAIQAGRDFDASDALTREQHVDFRSTPPRDGVVIINETMARRHWPGGALGAYLSTSYDRVTTPRRRIVGVVRDTVHQSLGAAPAPELYVPYREDPSFAFSIVARISVPLETIAPDIRRALRAVDPELATADIRRAGDIVGDSMGDSRAVTILMVIFASTALLLSGVGVYGMLGFVVARRTREIGIRCALGARARDIRWLLLRQLIPPVGIGAVSGVACGMAATLIFTRLVSELPPGIGLTDWRSYTGAVALTMAVALAAGYLPLRRAAAVELVDVLRRS